MKKRTLVSAIGTPLIAGHIALCPLHGLAWKVGLAGSSVAPAISQSKIGEVSAFLHNKQVELVADGLTYTTGMKSPKIPLPSYVSSMPTINREHLEKQNKYHPRVYKDAHTIVNYGNMALIGLALLPLAAAGYSSARRRLALRDKE